MAGFKSVTNMPPGQPATGPMPEQQESAGMEQTEGDEEAGNEGPEPNVSPEEQAIYDQAMTNALEIIYPKGEDASVAPQVLEGLKGGDNRMMSLATTAVSLVNGLRDSAKKAGQPIPGDILYHVGMGVTEELAEVAEAAKIHEFSEEEIEQSFYQALDMYRVQAEQTGNIDTDVLKAEWETIKQADAAGKVGEVLPGIDQRMKDAA